MNHQRAPLKARPPSKNQNQLSYLALNDHIIFGYKGGEIIMPLTIVKVIEGVFSKEQKAQIIQKVTEAEIEVWGEGMRDVTWVIVEEIKPGDWAIGGKVPKPKPKS